MVIKNWNQDAQDNESWTHEKTGNEIDISKGNTKWFVFLTKEGNSKQISNQLNTKNDATTFAKAWMRRNPNG